MVRVNILKHGKVMEFTHIHVADVFPLELTIYAPNELSHRPRSSTDGRPIVRVRIATLRKLCEREHAELWARYLVDFGLQFPFATVGPVVVAGNPDIHPSTIDSIELDYDRALSAIDSSLRVALFAQRNQDLISPVVDPRHANLNSALRDGIHNARSASLGY